MFTKNLKESIDLKSKIIQETNLDVLSSFGDQIINSIKSGGKLLVCGNGGSAADAQHLSAEFTGKYAFDRDALASIALGTNKSSSPINHIKSPFAIEETFKTFSANPKFFLFLLNLIFNFFLYGLINL